jgi:hypothetical protein
MSPPSSRTSQPRVTLTACHLLSVMAAKLVPDCGCLLPSSSAGAVIVIFSPVWALPGQSAALMCADGESKGPLAA